MEESPKRGLLSAYGRLLGPLVRILIRNGVSFEEFEEVAKQTYVTVAAADFETDETPQEKRIAALTGIEIEEVLATQQSIKASSDKDQVTLDGIVRVLTAWHTDSDFTGPYGIPLEVTFDSDSQPNFTRLARKYFSDIDPIQLLNKLIEAGLVVETEKGWFKVLARRYRPDSGAPDGLEHLARTFQDLVNTVDLNQMEDDPKKRLFERQVYTEDGIRPEDLPRFQAFVNTRANLLLEEIDNWLTQLEKPNTPAKERVSTGLGIFHYVHKGDQ